MENIMFLIVNNLEKVGIGTGLFLGSYLANMGLGMWKNVKIDGTNFDWKKISQSIIKFLVLGVSIGLLSCVVSVIPAYATYIGIEIEAETLETIDSLVIIGAFLTATMKYATEAIAKLKAVLSDSSITETKE